MGKQPSSRLIAEACGFNQSTVSRALKNHPSIPAVTRERILAVAAELGWRPNPLASAYLAQLHAMREPEYRATLGYLITSRDHARLPELPYYQQACWRGAQERAATFGYTLDPIWVNEPGMTALRLGRLLKSRGIPGLLLPGVLQPSPALAELDWSHFASASMGFSYRQPLHRVAFYVAHGLSLVLRRVEELGYKRIAVIISREYDTLLNHGVLQSVYYARHEPWGRTHLKSLVFPDTSEEERARIMEWIRRHRPDVIVGEEFVWRALQRMNWAVPRDVAYVSLDWAPTWPGIGGVDQRHEIIGAMAVDIVASELMQNERGLPAIPKLLLVEGIWRDDVTIPDRR